MVDEVDYIELGLLCADICRVLDQGTNGKKPDELSRSVYDAINLLTLWVEPTTCIPNRPLKCLRSQDRDKHSEKAGQAG